MRKSKLHLLSISLVISITCCQTQDGSPPTIPVTITEDNSFITCPQAIAQTQPVSHQFIVKFVPNASEEQRGGVHQFIRDTYAPHVPVTYECPFDATLVLIDVPIIPNPEMGAEDNLAPEDGVENVFRNLQFSFDANFPYVVDSAAPKDSRLPNQNPELDVVVAVLDGGILFSDGVLSSKIWQNPSPRDYDGDTIFDDLHGYDFTSKYPGAQPDIKTTHGTSVGRLVVNGISQSKVLLMDLQIFDHLGRGNLFDALCAIKFATDHGADIISNSWGYHSEGMEEDTIFANYLRDHTNQNQVVVASAGNKGQDTDVCYHYPSGYNHDDYRLNNVISVAAIDNPGSSNLTSYSNFGKGSIGIAADGIHTMTINGQLQDISGTSFAAPMVTNSVVQLMIDKPSLAGDVIVNCIIDTAIDQNFNLISGGELNPSIQCEN